MEKLQHETVDITLEYEERSYETTFWVTTVIKAPGVIGHLDTALQKLQQYRHGQNETGADLLYRPPTVVKVTEGKFTLCQYLGTQQGAALSPPAPTDDTVSLETWPHSQAYVRCFGGIEDDEGFLSEVRNLSAFLSEFHCGGSDFDEYCVATFDPEDQLWAQKNEIWFMKLPE